MLIDQITALTSLGAKKPLFLAEDDVLSITAEILPSLTKVIDSLDDGTETKTQLETLKNLLEGESLEEFQLAKTLTEISGVFTENTPEELASVIETFRVELNDFYKRAQLHHSFAQKRTLIKTELSEEKIAARDKKLSESVGMMYVLEYLLTIYKAIEEVEDEKAKMYFISSRTISLTEGEFPGLWFDLSSDEILTKYILDVLNDDHRNQLIESFYAVKDVFMRIDVECDLSGQCSASYAPGQVEELTSALSAFISNIIKVYRQMGIETLASVFLAPYGEKTKLTDLPF